MTMTLPSQPDARLVTPGQQPSLAELAEGDGVRFVLATFTTLTGKACSKLVPARSLEALCADGVGFAGYAAGAMGQQQSDPDIMVLPDVSSYVALPFIRPGLAMVHCDPYVNGAEYPFAPRVILKHAIARLAERGLSLQAGAEVEYFLVRRMADGSIRVADELDDSDQPCYDARGVSRMYDHLSAVSDAMDSLGWGPYASDHEDANGQFEQNFLHADVLRTADRVMTLRYIISMLAEQRGMTATFMPKPFADRTGNGLHLHLSIWDGDRPLFPAGDTDPYGLGLSPAGYGFVAGLLAHAPALQALIAPTVNSYKRTGAVTTASGATWAPSKAPSYGGNDRTHFIRVPDGNRIELRGGDGSANPYLATAAALTAGMTGLSAGSDPDEPGVRNELHSVLPTTLLEAIAALAADPLIRGVLDSVDPTAGVSDYYLDLKRDEFYTWHNSVTSWELQRYLTA